MPINRRRAPKSEISSQKKHDGHRNESEYASLIGGSTLKGTQKSDVVDSKGRSHSVKSGKKWQVFLYGYDRIRESENLKVLQPCLEAFPSDAERYFRDRIACIEFKEAYVSKHGKDRAKELSNEEVRQKLSPNTYITSKERLAIATEEVKKVLSNRSFREDFLREAIFNNGEVSFLAAKDETYKRDKKFKVFAQQDVLEVLSDNLIATNSRAGFVPEDYNVSGQKTLLCYERQGGILKNLVEIEIRNDSPIHYRQVRFNMYSRDVFKLLLDNLDPNAKSNLNQNVVLFGRAIQIW